MSGGNELVGQIPLELAQLKKLKLLWLGKKQAH